MKKKIKVIFRLGWLIVYLYGAYTFAMCIAKNKDRNLGKYKKYYFLMCAWNDLKKEQLSAYLNENNIKSIAIYGARDMGKRLYYELEDINVKVSFFIDQSSYSNSFSNIPLYAPEQFLPEVDAIVVTPYTEINAIKQKLQISNKTRILSIEDVIYESLKK